jgi:hypothetical protein
MNFQTMETDALLAAYHSELSWRRELGEHVALEIPVADAEAAHTALRVLIRYQPQYAEIQDAIVRVIAQFGRSLDRTPAIAEAHRRGVVTPSPWRRDGHKL